MPHNPNSLRDKLLALRAKASAELVKAAGKPLSKKAREDIARLNRARRRITRP